jgi:uncharacterized protein (TIGR02246 family)
MRSQHDPNRDDSDLAGLTAIPMTMIDAWNHGDAARFGAPFSATATFIAFEGTVLTGRHAIIEFHQPLFDTVLHGSRLVGEVHLTRRLDPQWALVHASGSTILPGENAPSSARESMQLFLARRHRDGWLVEAMQNSRIITLAGQQFLDDMSALPGAARDAVIDLAAALAARSAR